MRVVVPGAGGLIGSVVARDLKTNGHEVGHGTAWGISQAQDYTLGLRVGGIARKPGLLKIGAGERIELREFVSLTHSIDHEIVEGAPAARFTNRRKESLEDGAILAEPSKAAPLFASTSAPR